MRSCTSKEPRWPPASPHVMEAVGCIGDDLAPVAWTETPHDRLTPLQAQVLDDMRPRKVLTAEEIAAEVGVSTCDARRTLPVLQQLGFVTAKGAVYRVPCKSDVR